MVRKSKSIKEKERGYPPEKMPYKKENATGTGTCHPTRSKPKKIKTNDNF